MKRELELGKRINGQRFLLPFDLVTRTLAIIAIRGWGKTVAATVLAEEMCEAGLPWVALDPVGVWWGLRVNPDGTPGGYPVVVVGGEHGDLPLEKSRGPEIADALLEENVSCVIDLSGESKSTWRHFLTEFCERLLELRPVVPRHIFIEEAPEFVPQKPLGEQKRSLAAVDRLIRLGRNWGYGATLISQRFATIQKDVLTQCENLLAGRSIGKHDRDAARDWIAEVVGQTESEKKAGKFMESLVSLESGVGWFWSPQWLNEFAQVRVRGRKTYHPGETRTVGQAAKQIALSDVREFVGRLRTVLDRKQRPSQVHTAVPSLAVRKGQAAEAAASSAGALPRPTPEEDRLRAENQMLRAQNADLHRQLGQVKAALDAVRKVVEPEYRAMQKLFVELDAAGAASGADAAVFEPWKARLGDGPAKMIDALLSRGGELTKHQLSTLSGYSISSSTFDAYLSRLRRNGLIETQNNLVRLRVP